MCTLKQLSDLDLEAQHKARPNFPKEYLVRVTYSDADSNSFNKAICRRIELFLESFATRMSVEGRVRVGKVSKDFMGNKQHQEIKRLPSSNLPGSFDVTTCVLGCRLEVEIKVGKDVIRPEQLKFKQRIESAEGYCMIVKNWEDFDNQWKVFLKSRREHFNKMINILNELGL